MRLIIISTRSWFRAKVYVHMFCVQRSSMFFFVLNDIGLRLSYFGVQWQVDHNGDYNKLKHCQSTFHCVCWVSEVHTQWLVVDELK
jgi:hypothetical protein